MVASILFSADLLFKGAVGGLVISVVAMGIVLVYRSSRIVNFAVGDLGVPATVLLGVMVSARAWPYWPSFFAALAIGASSGAIIEVAVIRRLSKSPRVIVLVATIGVAQFAQAIARTIPDYRKGANTTASQFPIPFHIAWTLPGDIRVTGAQLMVLITVPVVAFLMWWVLGHTVFGEAVQATATNADLARMTGINPKFVSSGVWTIAGTLSALGIVLTATLTGASDIVKIGPDTLLKALVAALIAGMVSFPRAVLGSIALGVAEQFFRQNVEIKDPTRSGMTKFVLLLIVLVLVARVAKRRETGAESLQFSPRIRPIPDRLRQVWWAHRLPQITAAVGALLAVAAPLFTTSSAAHQNWGEIVGFALCAVSIVVLTGWAGQLSLGQMAFGGIGALTAAAFARGIRFELSLSGVRLFKTGFQPVPFWAAILLGSIAATIVAAIIGLGALRVRGLLLGISTLAFSIASSSYIFRRPMLAPGLQTSIDFKRQAIGPLKLADANRNYYWFMLGCLFTVLLVFGHLRRSGIGRTIVGVRENEHGAAAFTISASRAKLTAFMIGGFAAGLGGALLGGLAQAVKFSNTYFTVEDSLRLVAIAVIGGLGSLSGAVVGSLWIIGLPLLFRRNETVLLFTSSIGLLIMLLYLPGGFTQIGYWIRDSLLRWTERRLPPVEHKTVYEPPAAITHVSRRAERSEVKGPLLATTDLRVEFGGNIAVDGVDLRLERDEVVGLIGTNGAGKSTLLNAIGGFLPATGTVMLLGQDVSKLRPDTRAQRGLGRTFQAASLFPELTVRETVQLAMEARSRTQFWPTLLFLPRARTIERSKRVESDELIDFLGLGRYADRFVAELSTGTRRIVELAAILAVAPQVLCLDEPTAGVAQREAEAFGPLIKRVQRELGASLIIVEHDMPLILSISDRVYCLEAGRVIAEGRPDEIRANPLVIASYLGTDDRAINRSDKISPAL